MIIVTLMGGLGNQMFEYAFARNLSLKYNTDLKIDLSFLKNRNMGSNFVYRDYDLDMLNVVGDFEIRSNNVIGINEPHYNYSKGVVDNIDISIKNNRDILVNGYWQSPIYFKEFEDQIRKDFTFKNKVEDSDDYIKSMLLKIKSTNSIMINIRRSDYLDNNYHGVYGMEYLDNAVELIKSKVENPHYFIFSDDIDWCMENIKYENMTIVDHSYKGNRFEYYLQLMINCKHFIIPNSSFAWWAAWLNEDSNKIVISPKKWFTDSSINTNDLIPSNWIRI